LSGNLGFLCCLLAAGPTFAGGPPPELPSVLYTTFQQPASAGVVRALEQELEIIMGPLGRHYEWRSLANVRGNEVAAELAVLTFRGRCDVNGLLPHSAHPGALGWTHVSDGAILPFSEIECDRVRNFLQKDLLCYKNAEREEMFGRALARVVAHELYHIFANTQHHGSDGVAKAAYTVQELLSDEFEFEPRESEALRSSAPKSSHPQNGHATAASL